MDIMIRTKFGFKDTPYGYYNGEFYKFRIDRFQFNYNGYPGSSTNHCDIAYDCTAILPEGEQWDCTFQHTFMEYELYTKEELVETLKKLTDVQP